MSVIEKAPACTVCTLPSPDDPGCGCKGSSSVSIAPSSKVAGAAAMSGLAAVACASCCILPFTLPSVLLASFGGAISLLDHAHVWVTRVAIGAVACAWGWLFYQTVRTGKKPARSTKVTMAVATVLTLTAASWPLIEPLAFHAFGVVKKHTPPRNE
jgi:hypothetical protein